MSIPPPLVRLVHIVLVDHYRQHHRDLDTEHAEAFALAFREKLLGPITTAEASRAASELDIQPLAWVSPGADEMYQHVGALRQTLCREIRHWLAESGVWRFNVQEKALAYVRAVANAADAATYRTAVQNAKNGYMQEDSYADLPEHERTAIEVENRYQEGRRRW